MPEVYKDPEVTCRVCGRPSTSLDVNIPLGETVCYSCQNREILDRLYGWRAENGDYAFMTAEDERRILKGS